MKKILSVIFLFTLLASACNQDDLLQQASSSSSLKFTASFEQNESRTYIDADKDLHWSKGDEISLFYGNTDNQQYLFDGNTGDIKGTFSPAKTTSNVENNSLAKNYAVYPYSSNVEISENGVITATLPATQSYVENSFGLDANTMVAITENTEDKSLFFKNVGGYLKLQLYGTNVTVKSITLTGNNNEKLAGQATITPVYNQDPTVTMNADATKSITLDCGENGVMIGTTAATATAFWIVVPPTTFESGFTVSIINDNDETITKTTSNKIVVERNVIKPMESFELEFTNWFNPNQYITYVKNEETIYPNDDDTYIYSSYIDNPIGIFSKIEFKYEMKVPDTNNYSNRLCGRNDARENQSKITLNSKGLYIEDETKDDWDEYLYSWEELKAQPTDRMVLTISFKDSYISLNGTELEYKMNGLDSFKASYLFTRYSSVNDEGTWRVRGEGVTEGSKLYYVKIWDENDNLVYLGAASKAVNPQTSQEEYCWRSYYNGEYKYEFAYKPTTHSNYAPYGGGTD